MRLHGPFDYPRAFVRSICSRGAVAQSVCFSWCGCLFRLFLLVRLRSPFVFPDAVTQSVCFSWCGCLVRLLRLFFLVRLPGPIVYPGVVAGSVCFPWLRLPSPFISHCAVAKSVRFSWCDYPVRLFLWFLVRLPRPFALFVLL